MAKRTTKKEKIIDLKSKPEKITSEQLERLQRVISNINNFQLELGIMETRKHNLLHNLAGIQDQLTMMQEEFQHQYKTSDINIQDGTINYPENGETDKKD